MHGFLYTSAVVSWNFLINLGPIEGARRIVNGAWSVLRVKLAYPRTLNSFARNQTCRRCEMHSGAFDTCGDPSGFFRDAEGKQRPLGCHCIVRISNRDPQHPCWLKYHGLPGGWSESLMPDWWKEREADKQYD